MSLPEIMFEWNDENGFPDMPLTGLEAYDSPFGEDSVFNEDVGYVPFVNFQKLLPDIRYFKGRAFDYYYKNYESYATMPVRLGVDFLKELKETYDRVKQTFQEEMGEELPSVYATKKGPHAVIIDAFEDDLVILRDPLPQYAGSAYSIKITDFEEIFNKRAIIVKK